MSRTGYQHQLFTFALYTKIWKFPVYSFKILNEYKQDRNSNQFVEKHKAQASDMTFIHGSQTDCDYVEYFRWWVL